MNNFYIATLSFLTAFLGCFQIINLARHRRVWAGFTSCCIGACQLHIYRLAPSVDGVAGTFAFVLGGMFGAQFSMWITAASNTTKGTPPEPPPAAR